MDTVTTSDWGRVGDDGTVYVKTADGERAVGQMPDAPPEEALAFYHQALRQPRAGGGPARTSGSLPGCCRPRRRPRRSSTVRGQLADAHAVGDLAALARKLDGLGPVIATQRAARKAEKAQRAAEAREQKERLADEAEKIAAGKDWRNGANRLRELLDKWKQLPRHRQGRPTTSSGSGSPPRARRTPRPARPTSPSRTSSVTRPASSRSDSSPRPRALADSTDWGPTAGAYRDLMREWKAAGPAPRGIDDALWKRFRGAQDTFFGARDAANAALDSEFAANAVVKEQILVEAEALVPRSERDGDLAAAKARLPRRRRPVGRGRQGAAGPDQGPRGPDARRRAGHPQGRGRAVAQLRPREVRPRRRHGRQARRPRSSRPRPSSRRPARGVTRRRSVSSRRTSRVAGRSSRWRSGRRRTTADSGCWRRRGLALWRGGNPRLTGDSCTYRGVASPRGAGSASPM